MARNIRKKNTKAQNTNDVTWRFYYNWLKLIALNIVKWENVPETIDVRYLELMLFERGTVVFFKDEALGYLTLPVNLSGKFNVYGIPMDYYAYSSANGYQNRNLDDKNSVLIFNNFLRTPNEMTTRMFTDKLYNLDRTIDVNVSSQRTPVLVGCSEQQKLTMRNLMVDYDENEPYIFLDNKIDLSGLSVMNTQANFVGDKLESLLHNKINDYLSCFGIENSNADKKERMVTDEVNANYGLVETNRSIFLRPREIACEQINKMFGLNIQVSFNSELRTLINADKFLNDEILNTGGGDIE